MHHWIRTLHAPAVGVLDSSSVPAIHNRLNSTFDASALQYLNCPPFFQIPTLSKVTCDVVVKHLCLNVVISTASSGFQPLLSPPDFFPESQFDSPTGIQLGGVVGVVARSQEGYVQTAAIAREQALKLGKTESGVPPPPMVSMDDVSSQLAHMMDEVDAFTQRQVG